MQIPTIGGFYGEQSEIPLVKVFKVANGWIVTVHNNNRDKEISDETKEKRRLEKEKKDQEYRKSEEERIRRDIETQLTSMAVVGKMAGKMQARGVDEEVDSWKESKEELSVDDMMASMQPQIEKLAASSASNRPGSYGNWFPPIVGSKQFKSPVESYIFTDRAEMIKFVMEMLEPEIE